MVGNIQHDFSGGIFQKKQTHHFLLFFYSKHEPLIVGTLLTDSDVVVIANSFNYSTANISLVSKYCLFSVNF